MYHPQPDPVPNPYSSHYPNQYPILTSAITSSLPYFPSFQHPQLLKPAPISEISPPEPPEPSITPSVASKSVQRLISLELQRAGFDSAVQPAVQRLEVELVTCMEVFFCI
jgi:transcription initiation factor TFIID subunit 8